MDARPAVAVDLDGVLATYDPATFDPKKIGDPIPGAVEFTRHLSKFADVIVHTARAQSAAAYELIGEWLRDNEFAWNIIRAKPLAAAYVDDRAVECRPQEFKGDGQFTLALGRCARLCQAVTEAEAKEH